MPAQQPNQDQRRVEYEAYIASPAWQVKRAVALERAGHRCQLGAAHKGLLDVHHNSYERFGGDELPEDLVVLCRKCHEKHHGGSFDKPRAQKKRRSPNSGLPATVGERTTVLNAMVEGHRYTTHQLATALDDTAQRTGTVLASLRKSRQVARDPQKRWKLRIPDLDRPLTERSVSRVKSRFRQVDAA